MRVLVAREESQRVCIEFRKKGHEAYSCDIIECSGGHPEWHIKEDVLLMLDKHITFFTQNGDRHYISEWDMIIAFPPCTYFTTAGACRMYHKDKITGESVIDKDRYNKMLEFRRLFMSIYNAKCDKICIENPTPMKLCHLPQYSQVIQPYMFGHPYTKRTLFWLKGLPELKPTTIVEPITSWVNGGHKAGLRLDGKLVGNNSNACDRSKTFEGVAKAMAEQWG